MNPDPGKTTNRPTATAARSGPGAKPLEALVEVLRSAPSADPGAGLADLGGPATLDRLLRGAVGAAVGRGPGAGAEGWGPARLVAASEAGARAGTVPAATASRLRGVLERLEVELHRGRFWSPSVAPWWRPLPPPGPLEELWDALDGAADGPGALDGLDGLREALGDLEGPGRLCLPDGLPDGLVRRVHRELLEAVEDGSLDLARAGVGPTDRATPVRTDRVAYRTGLEPELLEVAPAVAVLIQWVLSRLPERLSGGADGARTLHAPATAMLARYEAPGGGFAPHLDNPGGYGPGRSGARGEDNHRAVSLVAYLNAPEAPCSGGEIALWAPGAGRSGSPADVLPAAGGSVVLFDSRRVLHEVRPLAPGPDRWTLVVWLSDAERPPALAPEPPRVSVAEALEPLEDETPVPAGRVLLRSVRNGALHVESVPVDAECAPTAGLVCTAHRADDGLGAWLRHHLEAGFDRLLVVLDEVAEEGELERARRLADELDPARITLWSAREASDRWPALAEVQPDVDRLRAAAAQGTATDAVAARQTLNASAALRAAQAGEIGGPAGERLDWLVHLDSDELFHLQGRARGGADLRQHFAALRASGRTVVRYADHELLLVRGQEESGRTGPRFKLNPRLAAARLGPVGWRRLTEHLNLDQEMEREGSRPYFRAYWNGKSAVAVAAGRSAAGVHGWLAEGAGERDDEMLAGPAILHLHLPTREAFRDKYRMVARGSREGGEGGRPRAFPPSPLEELAVGAIREALRSGGGEAAIATRLDALYEETLRFGPEEVDLLEEAGLLLAPDGSPAFRLQGEGISS